MITGGGGRLNNTDNVKLQTNYYGDHALVMPFAATLKLAKSFVGALDGQLQSSSGKGAASTYSHSAFIKHLVDNRAYLTANSVRHCVEAAGARPDSKFDGTIDDALSKQLSEQLLHKIMAAEKVDSQLALACMLSMEQKSAFAGLKVGLSGVNNDFARLMCLSQIGIRASILWKQQGFTHQLEQLAKNAKWWRELKILGIKFSEEKFRVDDDHVRSLVPQLLTRTNYDLAALFEYADAYNIESDWIYLALMRLILGEEQDLVRWEPQLIAATHDTANKRKMSVLLKEMQQTTSPYDYERIAFIFRLIRVIEPDDEVAKKAALIMSILDGYTRSEHKDNGAEVS